MKKCFLPVFIMLSTYLIFNNTINAQSQIQAKVVNFVINGATDTYVTCVNDSNDIAGYFYNGSVDRGFIYLAKTIDTIIINYPGATNTRIYGINNNKVVVGSFNATGNIADNNGFKYTQTTNLFEETTAWLGHTHKVTRDINETGCVVGDHRTNPSTSVCHISCGGIDSIFHYNYNTSFINGINNAGRSVGFWMNAPYNYGFIRDISGAKTDLNYPGATRTRLMGINDSNMVVGTFDLTRSFIYKHGSFKEIVKSGTADFQVQDINNYGTLVGFYKNASNNAVGFYMPFCDIGFRPDTNGWVFGNSEANIWPYAWYSQFNYSNDPYLGWPRNFPKVQYNNGTMDTIKRNRFPDWPLFVRTFGVENCYDYVFGIPFLKNNAFNKWRSIYDEWGGSCFGFTQSAFMVWDSLQLFKANYPDVGPWTQNNRLYELPINNHNRLCINELQIKQHQKAFSRHIAIDELLTPIETLYKLKKMLLDNDKDEGGLVFLNQNGSGGHIVNPYKVEIDTLNPQLEYIYVYDNNQPGDTTRRVTVNKTLNAWYYFLSINAGVGADQWGGNHANKGMFVTWPASSFYAQPIVDSVKYSGLSFEKNSELEVYNSTNCNILINNISNESIGYINNTLINNISGASPFFSLIGNQIPMGYLLPQDDYNIEMKDFSSGLVTFSLYDQNKSYVYSRGNALISEQDHFEINSDGIITSNANTLTKIIRIQAIADDNGAEKTFTLSEMPMHNNTSFEFSILNNDKLKVVNTGVATSYNIDIHTIAANNVGSFVHDSIAFDANTTHIINVNWSNIQNADVCIYIDNGNNGINDDTLCFINQGVPEIVSFPVIVDAVSAIQTDTVFIGNGGSGTMAWGVTSDSPSWLSITGASTGTDFGYIRYTLTANTGSERIGHLIINAPGALNSPYTVEIKQEGLLPTPINLTASDGTFSDGVHVSWDALPGATHYMLYRSTVAGNNGTPITGWITATNYIDNTTNGGDFYYYSVKAAQNASGLNETGFSIIDDGWRACFTANFSYNGECVSQPTLLTSTSSVHSFAHFLWDIDNNGTIDYTGENISHVFTSTGSKTVKLTVTDSSLCENSVLKTINILAFPNLNLPDTTVLCHYQSLTLNAGAGFSTYLWSTGATSQSVSIDSAGFGLGAHPVYVSVTNSNGCATIDTAVIVWNVCTKITKDNISDFDVNVYPNPSNSIINIVVEGNISDLFLEMLNLNGQRVYERKILDINGHYNTTIDTKKFKQGIYFLRCTSNNRTEIKKLIFY